MGWNGEEKAGSFCNFQCSQPNRPWNEVDFSQNQSPLKSLFEVEERRKD